MSAVADTHGHDVEGTPDDFVHAGHHPDSFYVRIAIFLAVITAAEVTLSYMHIGVLYLPVLFILMTIKFVMVVLFFMHLKFDSKWFNMAFWSGLGLALGVYLAALCTFQFFAKS